MKLVTFGDIGRYIKVVPRSVVIQSGVVDTDTVQDMQHGSIVVCCPPTSTVQTIQMITHFREQELEFECIIERIEILELLNAFDNREKYRIYDTMTTIFALSKKMHNASYQPCTEEWKIECASMYAGDNVKLTTAQLIKSYSNASNLIYTPTKFVDESTIGAIKYILDKLEGSTWWVNLVRQIIQTPEYSKLIYIDDIRQNRDIMSYGTRRIYISALLREETSFARQKGMNKIMGNEAFIIPLSHVIDMEVSNAPRSEEHAHRRIEQFVGTYLDKLDLSETAISGSAISASLIVTRVECSFAEIVDVDMAQIALEDDRYERYLQVYYPRQITVPVNQRSFGEHMDQFCNSFRGDFIPAYTVTRLGQYSTIETVCGCIKTKSILKVVDGSDVDMAVDVDTWERFDIVAAKHIAVIQNANKNIIVHKVISKFGHKWKIRGGRHFRSVEIYRAPFEHILTHHMGMVCGAYTAMFSDEPEFIITSRLVRSMDTLSTPNFYYFPSEISSPERIILKYYARGFYMYSMPQSIMNLITDEGSPYSTEWCLYNPRYPTSSEIKGPVTNGRGQFNVHALHYELDRHNTVVNRFITSRAAALTEINALRIE
jgi:hypothetical protein